MSAARRKGYPRDASLSRLAPALFTGPQPRPDLLVSDIGMPECDGYRFVEQVRQLPAERGGAIPAIALTAFARSEDRARALGAGYQLHLTKPIEPHELLAAVGRLSGRARAG